MKAEFLSFWLISLRDGSVEMMYSKERNKSTRTVSLEAKREVSSISLNILEYVTVYYTRNKKKTYNVEKVSEFWENVRYWLTTFYKYFCLSLN